MGRAVSKSLYGREVRYAELAEKLLDLGANVDVGEDNNGNTVLMCSIKESMPLPLVERILSQSNRSLEPNKMNETALILAIKAAKKKSRPYFYPNTTAY